VFLLLSLFKFFLKVKFFITPLIFICITYYYLAKNYPIFKAYSYIYIFYNFVIDFVLYVQYYSFKSLISTLDL